MLIIGLLTFTSLFISGLDDTTVLKGNVRDSENEIYIQAATVKVKNEDGQQVHPTVLTDAAQEFHIEDLPAGTYLVKAHFTGFQSKIKEAELEAGGKCELKFKLTPKSK